MAGLKNESEIRAALLDAAKPHVAFDGWTEATFAAAVEDAAVTPALAKAVCPRGAVDLALAYHAAGDQVMLDRLAAADLSEMRFRDRVAFAVQARLEVAEKELVRRGVTLFALPPYVPDGTKAIWGTADHIWTALGDTSGDYNWYSKRLTLSGVYSASVLYWLGDQSEGQAATRAFLDRRIEDVMQFEKFKSSVQDSKILGPLMAGPMAILGKIRAPQASHQTGMPGRWNKGR